MSLSTKRDDFLRYVIWLNETIHKKLAEESEKVSTHICEWLNSKSLKSFSLNNILFHLRKSNSDSNSNSNTF